MSKGMWTSLEYGVYLTGFPMLVLRGTAPTLAHQGHDYMKTKAMLIRNPGRHHIKRCTVLLF